ncbi:MAG: hypothetical protein JW940_02445 [Polyangiaceae bacterium]|nr:hypothetical protein [Polyangiaceae bacterium]
MKRSELEHLIRAAATIADDDELIVIGSQAILGQFPDAPAELCVSTEADIYPKNHPERWDLIDGSIGELSPFHETFGYYAQGVEEGTATLPAGYQERLVSIRNANTRGATGYCLEAHDLLISKYVAGRDKDRRFTRAAIAHALVQETLLLERLERTELTAELRERIRRQIRHDFALGHA